MIYNTQKLIDTLTGKNKAFITRVARHQEERYGNVDIFTAIVGNKYSYGTEYTSIETQFGDYYIDFTFDYKGDIVDTYGNGQGHKYHKSLESVARELYERAYYGKQSD